MTNDLCAAKDLTCISGHFFATPSRPPENEANPRPKGVISIFDISSINGIIQNPRVFLAKHLLTPPTSPLFSLFIPWEWGYDSHAYGTSRTFLLNSRQISHRHERGTYQLICFGYFLLPGLHGLKYSKESSGGLNDTQPFD